MTSSAAVAVIEMSERTGRRRQAAEHTGRQLLSSDRPPPELTRRLRDISLVGKAIAKNMALETWGCSATLALSSDWEALLIRIETAPREVSKNGPHLLIWWLLSILSRFNPGLERIDFRVLG